MPDVEKRSQSFFEFSGVPACRQPEVEGGIHQVLDLAFVENPSRVGNSVPLLERLPLLMPGLEVTDGKPRQPPGATLPRLCSASF